MTLNISETDNSLDFGLARSVARYFRLNKENAENIIAKVKKAVNDWRKTAKLYNISNSEQDQMTLAFEKRTP